MAHVDEDLIVVQPSADGTRWVWAALNRRPRLALHSWGADNPRWGPDFTKDPEANREIRDSGDLSHLCINAARYAETKDVALAEASEYERLVALRDGPVSDRVTAGREYVLPENLPTES